MKTIMLLLVLISAISLNAQQKIDESAVPAKVKATFKKLYPGSKVEYWTREEKNYVAEFDHDKKEMILFISSEGEAIKTENRIHPSGLPHAAQAYIAAHYPGKKITDAVTSSDFKGNHIYEAEVDEIDLIFDANGKFLKSVKERAVE